MLSAVPVIPDLSRIRVRRTVSEISLLKDSRFVRILRMIKKTRVMERSVSVSGTVSSHDDAIRMKDWVCFVEMIIAQKTRFTLFYSAFLEECFRYRRISLNRIICIIKSKSSFTENDFYTLIVLMNQIHQKRSERTRFFVIFDFHAIGLRSFLYLQTFMMRL